MHISSTHYIVCAYMHADSARKRILCCRNSYSIELHSTAKEIELTLMGWHSVLLVTLLHSSVYVQLAVI